MLVTINTDASWDPDLKIGAYAFWIISDGFRVKQAGVFREDCLNPHDAEAKAILNALHVLGTKEGYISKIIFNTDSLNSIAIFERDMDKIYRYLGKKHLQHWKYLYRKFKRLKKKLSGMPAIEFRHVRAHTGVEDRRSKVNEWCDDTAKHFLRVERNKIKGNGN